MALLIPELLETTRLRLRTVKEDDWSVLHEYYSDEESTRYTTLQPLSEEESRRTVASMERHWQRHGYGPYLVEDKASAAVLGIVGLWYPKQWPEPEIKWALLRKHWGQGYAGEAARAVQAMAARQLPQLHLISLIHCDNHASARLAVAVGASMEKAMQFRGAIYHVYRHSRPE